MSEIRTAKDGTQYFHAKFWGKEDAHFKSFGEELSLIVSGELNKKKNRELLKKVMPDLITWIWSDFAELPGQSFYCKHPNEKYDEEFGLWGLELSDYFEDAQEYFRSHVGIPMWAEMSIENVDVNDANYNRPIEEIWGQGDFLNPEGSSLALIYAMQNANEGDLEYNKKLKPLDKFIVQDDPNWHQDQQTYYNWLEFDVTVEQKEVEREQALIGVTYKSMSEEQRNQVVLAAMDALNTKELEKQKVPQYLLSLLLNHPATPDESKSQITQLGDESIIEIRE